VNADNILGIALAITFIILGTYFNYKFRQVGKDEDIILYNKKA